MTLSHRAEQAAPDETRAMEWNPQAEAIAQEIADHSGWRKTSDTYSRIYQAAMLGAIRAVQPSRRDGRVNIAVELMGEALFALSDRMWQTDFIHSDSNPITDANAAAYERVVKAWDKLTSAIAKANGL